MASRPTTRSYSAFEMDGQRYERIAEEAHKTQRNTIAVITTWRSECADCGAEFTFTSAQKPGPTGPTRRCKACVSPTGKHKPVGSLAARRRKPTGIALDLSPELPLITHVPIDTDAVTREQIRRNVSTSRTPTTTTTTKPDVFTDR